MRKFPPLELKKIIRTITEWMIDDYVTEDIITQTMTKWEVDEKQAYILLDQVNALWKKNEPENNELKRLHRIESLKKLKRSIPEKDKVSPAGVSVILNIEKELFRLESMSFKTKTISSKKLLKELQLTGKQERFGREFVKDYNGTQAAIRAGYSKKTAYSIANENLRKPEIIKFIDSLQEDLREKAELTPEMVVQELRDLGQSNIQDFLNANNSIKDLTTLPLRKTKAVSGIKTIEKILPDGTRQITTELKLADRRATWVDLGRHTGIFEKDNLQKEIKIKVTRK